MRERSRKNQKKEEEEEEEVMKRGGTLQEWRGVRSCSS